ncbi:heavy metal translocating P-type ATPase [Bacillus sp. AFS053548]|uniref:heavy metal translocating P-type ATPase n=1 Tax=Bacillus sp. AFS053548 TaxID=2033505 RepID=UPI000BFCA51D|nr:heavy metal translocating P-type ATPase [Bacillus sp. AFS053548]PGM49125.1 cadmium-translocating P-type ATPase [Bacillus sp. AFS053548]
MSRGQRQVNSELKLEGLDCANCAMKIEKGISTLEGVDACSVNFATLTMTITTSEEQKESVIESAKDKIRVLEPHINPVSKMDTKLGQEKKQGMNAETKKLIVKLGIGTALLILAQLLNVPTLFQLIIFIAAYLIAGADVVLKAIRNIFRGQVFDENFLMGVATIGAFIIGEYPEAVAVMLFYQLGELFQSIAVNRSRNSISKLMDIRPDYANLKNGDKTEQVSPEKIQIGDTIIVKPGERVPLDGIVKSGFSSVDTSALTGESLPREIFEGDEVLSGFINVQGLLEIEVTKEFNESTVSKILELVQNATNKKAPTENFITKFAKVYTPIVVITAAIIAIIPPIIIPGETLYDWVYRALIFLVISCPCALVVSIPLGFFGGIGAASKSGVLVKGSNYLEALNDLKYIVFDKTGTLTKGQFQVSSIIPTRGHSKEELLELAAYGEFYSTHPIALSIRQKYGKDIVEAKLSNYTEIAGHGISVTINGDALLVGNSRLMESHSILYEPTREVGTTVYLAKNNHYIGSIVIADQLKNDAKKAILELKKVGIKKTVMLTGDANSVAKSIAKELGIDDIYSELLPHQKVEKLELIEKIKSSKEKIAFVGDGINDAPVLAQADIGIAMGGIGSDAAIEAADVVLMSDEPSKIVDAIKIAKRTRQIVWQNIFFALAVKGFFLLLGVIGIATMWEAVISDVGVTVLAVLNSMRVLRNK